MFRFQKALCAAGAVVLLAVGFAQTPGGNAVAQNMKMLLVEVVNVPDVSVVNNPLVQTQQSGSWNVGINGPVQVGNPATSPVFTRDIDNPARTAFLETCSAAQNSSGINECTLTIVPPGKLLVVEMFSGSATADGTAATVQTSQLLFLGTGLLGPVPAVHAVPVMTGTTGTNRRFVFSQITRAYVPAGGEVKAQVNTSAASSQSASFTIFGYLVDCGAGPGCAIP